MQVTSLADWPVISPGRSTVPSSPAGGVAVAPGVPLGSGVAVVLSMLATGLLTAYVKYGSSFGTVYGPLGGMFALLLWALLSAIAFFYGAAVCAQLEACRAGDHDPAYGDPGRPHSKEVEG